jgi:hypothetical protein
MMNKADHKTAKLQEWGFVPNAYDQCMMNKADHKAMAQ